MTTDKNLKAAIGGNESIYTGALPRHSCRLLWFMSYHLEPILAVGSCCLSSFLFLILSLSTVCICNSRGKALSHDLCHMGNSIRSMAGADMAHGSNSDLLPVVDHPVPLSYERERERAELSYKRKRENSVAMRTEEPQALWFYAVASRLTGHRLSLPTLCRSCRVMMLNKNGTCVLRGVVLIPWT